MRELKPSSTREILYINVTLWQNSEIDTHILGFSQKKTEFSSSTNEKVLNRTVQYSSKTPYLIVSGGLLAAEDRKMEDFDQA